MLAASGGWHPWCATDRHVRIQRYARILIVANDGHLNEFEKIMHLLMFCIQSVPIKAETGSSSVKGFKDESIKRVAFHRGR